MYVIIIINFQKDMFRILKSGNQIHSKRICYMLTIFYITDFKI